MINLNEKELKKIFIDNIHSTKAIHLKTLSIEISYALLTAANVPSSKKQHKNVFKAGGIISIK